MSSEGRKRKRPVPSGAGASGTGSGSRRAWNPPNATKHDDDETVEIEFAGARSAKDIAEQKERQREEMKRRLKKRQVIDLTALPVIEVIDLSKSSDDDDVPAPPPKRPRPSNSSNVSNPTVYRESTVIDISDGEPEPTPRPRRAMERARNAARKSVVLDAVVNGEPSSSSAAQLAQATDPPMLTPPPTSFTRPWALPLPSDAPVVPAPSPSHDRISPQIVDRDAPRLQFPTPGPSSPTNTRDQLPPSSSNLHVTITSATPDRAPSGLAFPANNEHRRLLDYSVTYPPEPTDQVEASAFALGPLRSLSVLPDSQPPSPAVDEDSPISTAALGLVARQMPVLPDSHEQEVQGGTTALGAVALRTSVLPDSQDASPMTALGLVTLRTTVLPDSQAPSPEPPSDNVITDELINARALTVQLPDSLDTVEALADDLPASEIFVSHLVSSVLADSQGDALVDLEDVTMDLAFVPFDRLPNSPKDELDELDEDLPATPIDAPLALQESGVEDLRDQEEDELDYDSYEVVESPEGESENDLDEAWEGEEEEEEEEEVDELFDEDEDLPARTSGRVALSLNGCKTSTSPSEDQPTADNEVQEGRHRPIESRGSSVSDLKTAEGFRMPDEFVAMAEQSDLRLREAVEGLTQGLTRVTAGALRWVTERVAGRVDGIEADDQLLDDDDVEDKQDSGAGLTTPAPLLRTTDSSPVIDVTTEGHAIPDSTDREEDRVLMPLVRSPAVSSLRQELGTDRYSAHQSTINVSEGPLSMVPAKERLRNEPTPPPPDHTDRPLSSQSSSLFSGLPTSRLQTWQPSSEDPDGWVCLESACGFTNHSTARRCRDCNAKRMAQPTVKNPKSCLDAKCPHGPFTSAVKYLGHIRFCNNSRPNRLSTVPPPAMPSAQSPTHSTSRHNASPATVRDHPPQQKQKDRPADVLVGVPSRRALPEQDHGIAVSPNPRSSESSSDISKADSILDDLETRPRATVDSLDTTPDPKVDERDHNDAILMGRTSSLSPVPVEPQNCHTTELSDDEEKDSLEADHMREESFDKAAENGTAQIETSPPPRPVGHSPLHQILASSSGDRSSSDNLISSPVTPITPSGVQIPPSAQSPPADGSSSTESSSRPQTLRMTITRKRKWDSVDAIDIALPIMPLVRRPTSPLRVAIPPSRVVIPSESHGTVPRPFVIPSSRVVIPSETNGSVPRPASVSQSPVEPGHSPLERTENPFRAWRAELLRESVAQTQRRRPPVANEIGLASDLGQPLLQDAMNGLPDTPYARFGFKSIFEAHIQENTALDELDAPPIKIVNNIDDDPCPDPTFVYTNKIIYGEGVSPPDLDALQGCDCEGPCDPNSKTCTCIHRQKQYSTNEVEGFVHNDKGILQSEVEPLVIVECNSACRCSIACQNRIIQRGRTVPITIKKTREKGWGVFTTEAIPKWTFVGLYAGELLTDEEAEERGIVYDKGPCTYLFDVDFYHIKHDANGVLVDDGKGHHSIDAYHYGNFTRFLNHSCSPNLTMHAAYINEVDVQKPLLVMYSSRKIDAGEELCFSYRGTDDERDTEEMKRKERERAGDQTCHCGSKNCRGYMFRGRDADEEDGE